MKMRVLLSDDEPSALRSMKSIIEANIPSAEIVGCAQNGEEALEKARALQPDILVTDIKMPLLNGIELTERLRAASPATNAVVVSGFQDFEYAKGAFLSGVEDYLLKPLDVKQICSIFEKLRRKKAHEWYCAGVEEIRQAINLGDRGPAADRGQERRLPDVRYCAALVRINGLPARFAAGRTTPAGFQMRLPGGDPEGTGESGVWYVEGRDDSEMFVFRAEDAGARSLTGLIRAALSESPGVHYTAVLSREPVGQGGFHALAGRLWETVDNRLVLGRTQLIFLEAVEQVAPAGSVSLDSSVETSLSYLTAEGKYDELREELERVFAEWERLGYPQIRIEMYVRQIVQAAQRVLSLGTGAHGAVDVALDEAFSRSTDFAQLRENIWRVVEGLALKRRDMNVRRGTRAFFIFVESYVNDNLAGSLSLSAVCSRVGISQTFLSRLFRKYANMSFNKYLTLKRLEKAKRLMESTEMPVQDVALAVGYDNPSYFSKVFRDVVGVPPSQYARAGTHGSGPP